MTRYRHLLLSRLNKKKLNGVLPFLLLMKTLTVVLKIMLAQTAIFSSIEWGFVLLTCLQYIFPSKLRLCEKEETFYLKEIKSSN